MRRLLLVAVLALAARIAHADSGLFYFGGGIGSDHANSLEPGFPNIDGTSWQAFAGIRPIRLFSIEADYFDLGSQTNTFKTPLACVSVGSCSVKWKSEAKTFAASVVGFVPIPLPYLDVYGKAGLARFRLNRVITNYNNGGMALGSSENPDDSDVVTWGAGVQAHFGIIGGRLEYAGFDRASASVLSLSVFLNL